MHLSLHGSFHDGAVVSIGVKAGDIQRHRPWQQLHVLRQIADVTPKPVSIPVANVSPIDADRAVAGGLEALFRQGPWTAQSEAFGVWIDDANGVNGESFLSGGYLSLSRFLGAGETRWSRGRGALGPPKIEGAMRPGGGGAQALEAVARLSYTDLIGGSVQAGRVLDLETGLNFYVSSTTRLMLHWVGVSAEPPAGPRENGWAVLGRLQIQI
mgnify:CR=1 FL=1